MSLAARLVALLALLVSLVAGAWFFYQKGYKNATNELVAHYQAEKLAAQQVAITRERQFQKDKDDAINSAKRREMAAKAAAADLRSSLDGLRVQLETASRELSSHPERTNPEYVTTVSDLFQQCSKRLAEMAGAADGHASDSLMYQQAWPRE